MNKNTYCVYMHKNKINGKIYVGQTIYGDNPNFRWKNGKGYKGNNNFWNDLQKYGWDNFEHCIIQNNLSLKEANELEKLKIAEFNAKDLKYGYNRHIVGNTNAEGKTFADSTKQLISINTSKAQIGLVWLHKDKTEIQVKPEQIQYYIEQGYTKGRFFDKVWIYNNTKTKMIHKQELQKYLNDGWTKGRFNYNRGRA